MRFLRRLLFGLLILAVLGGGAYWLLRSPSVQTWALQQLLEGQTAVTVAQIEATPQRIVLHDLRVESGDHVFTAHVVTADLAVRDLLLHRQANVSRLVATECRWEEADDLHLPRRGEPSEAGWTLPFDLHVRQAEVSGRSTFAAVWRNFSLPLTFSLSGSADAVRQGAFTWRARGPMLGGESASPVLRVEAEMAPDHLRGHWAVKDLTLPSLPAIRGEGTFERPESGKELRLTGTFATALDPRSPVTGKFRAVRHPGGLHLDELTLDCAGAPLRGTARLLQPIEIDESAGSVMYSHPESDFASLSARNYPLQDLPHLPAALSSLRGTVSGTVGLASTGTEGVTVHSIGRLQVNTDRCQASVTASGEVGSSEEHPWAVNVQSTLPLPPAAGTWREATVDLTGQIGTATVLDGPVKVVGRDPTHTIASTLHLNDDPQSGLEAVATMQIAFGAEQSDLTVDFTTVTEGGSTRDYVKASGDNARLDHIRSLLVYFVPLAPSAERDRAPFWKFDTGKVGISFEHLTFADGSVWSPVDGSLEITPRGATLEDCKVGLDPKRTVDVTGSVAFNAAAPAPYSLLFSTTLDKVESGPLFPSGERDALPWVEGRFTVHRSVVADGRNLADLLGSHRVRIDAESSTAIVRILAVNVADVVPQKRSNVGQDMGSAVGSVVGTIFGTKKNPLDSGRNPVAPKTEAVLQFTNETSELSFDHLTVSALEEPDGSYRITRAHGDSDTVQLTGSGHYSPGALSLNLNLAFAGPPAALLAKAGLIPRAKDVKTFVPLPKSVHLGGTPQRIDQKDWHDLLAAPIRNP